MNSFVFSFKDVNKTKINLVGGKGANLGELTTIEGIQVPDDFCITTEAFKKIIDETPLITEMLHQLSSLKAEDRNKIDELSSKIRNAIEAVAIPQVIHEEIIHHLSVFDKTNAFAIRSSATAEDLPTASFAGQHDSYLNIMGTDAILKHISKCWASLFTGRAIFYRIQNRFDHHKVQLAVVVQQMVFPQAAGIMFTADPVTSNRKTVSIDAGFGLGEAMVAGLVNADNYKVYNSTITDKKIPVKKLALYALQHGGTAAQELEPAMQNRQVLTDEQVVKLAHIGRKIEAHFGSPQDIEWCLADDAFYIVQSRPVTTLYPIPQVNDKDNHVYVSVGHQQMMTDAMKPLGLSLWQLTAGRAMYEAGGRMFVDVAPDLASPARRAIIIDVLGKSDPLVKDALTTIVKRDNFISLPTSNVPEQSAGKQGHSLADYQALQEYDPAIIAELINRSETAIATLQQNIQAKSGEELIDFILEDIQQLKKNSSDPQSFGVIMTGMNAVTWLNEKMKEWLGENNAADTLTQSAPNNITSAMGLALLDVADAIRPYPQVIAYLQQAKDDNFLDELLKLDGGKETQKAINNFLNKYGMRCAGEIDITRDRWSEKPTTLIPIILTNIKQFELGESRRKFARGLHAALRKEQELLQRLKQLLGGEEKADKTKRMINLVRNLVGYREYPKYSIVSRYFIYKQALLKEVQHFVEAKVIHEKEDIYYLTLEELRELMRTHRPDYRRINERKEAHKLFEKLKPPRVITFDGEIINGRYNHEHLPAHTIAGLAVSSGVVEGRARVILNMEDAAIADGDILVTAFTDPSWTPLFVSIKGLVTEVGGLMTHGSVIAREYGLPAVVGVENATRLIKDGQQIRVNGTDGYIEIL